MAVPTSVLNVLVTVPAVAASSLLWIVTAALVPSAVALPALFAGVAALVVLAAGVGERTAVLLITGTRSSTQAEEVALAPLLTRLSKLGIASGREILVRQRPRPRTPPAQLVGPGALVVTPWLIEAIHRRWLTLDEATALVVHAEGRRRAEQPGVEVAMLALTLPVRAVLTIVGGFARAVSWFPLIRFAWTIRGLVGVVAVIQQIAEGRLALAVLVGILIAFSYLFPAAARAKAARLEVAGDEAVVGLGLGPAYVAMLDRFQVPVSAAGRRRLRAPDFDPIPIGTQRHLELVHL